MTKRDIAGRILGLTLAGLLALGTGLPSAAAIDRPPGDDAPDAALTEGERPDAPVFVDSGITTFTPVWNGAAAWGDSDNDGDLDLLLTGDASATPMPSPVTKLYLKNGSNTYFEVPPATTRLPGVRFSSVAWGDYNNDDRLDVLLTGEMTGGAFISRVYRNDGNNQFTDINAGLIGVRYGAAVWGDFDNDGRLDIALGGESQSGAVTRLYRNASGDRFTPVNVTWPGISHGSIAWGDYNRDGWLDVAMTGAGVSKLYRNTGGQFVEINAGLLGLSDSAAAWGDFNNDGYPDLALVGTSGAAAVAKLYRNNADDTFTDMSNSGLSAAGYGAVVAWGDYDNDGWPDLLLNGNTATAGRVFRNNGNGTFSLIESGLPLLGSNVLAWGDYNNAGRLSVLAAGNLITGTLLTRVYSSTVSAVNAAPGTPGGLSASVTANSVRLRWQPATDDHTPAAALTYNVRVGTTPGGSQIVSPMALTTGYRQLVAAGPNVTTTVLLRNLKPGMYFWNVQAVDSVMAGSPFAAIDGTFVISYHSYLPVAAFNACPACFAGPNEVEPNNNVLQANGPLISGRMYTGQHNDEWDAYSLYASSAGLISADLQTPRTSGVQLQVYYLNTNDPNVQYRSLPPYHVDYNGAAGWYYIFVYTPPASVNAQTYTLVVTYP